MERVKKRFVALSESNNSSSPVLRLTSSYVHFDWMQPYNKHLSKDSTGTGFVLNILQDLNDDTESFLVMTAYHVVEMSKQLLVRVEASSTRMHVSTVVAACPELDVALIKVPAPLPVEIVPLQVGNSEGIFPLMNVQAQGYALGKPHLQYTTGVVSGRTSSKIQIDAAVNPGNSGGPLLCAESNTVIGIIVSGYNNAQNMNFACPMQEALRSLSRAFRNNKTFERVPSLNARFTTTPPSLTMHNSTPGGSMCTYVHPESCLYKCGLRRGDYLTKLNGYSVQFDGTIRTPFWKGPLPYTSLVARGLIGESVQAEVIKRVDGSVQNFSAKLEENKNVFKEYWPDYDTVRYCAKGGVVVQPLVANIAESSNSKLFHYKYTSMMDSPSIKAHSIAVVTHIMPTSPFNKFQTIKVGDMIIALNDHEVNFGGKDTFQNYVDAWEKVKEEDVCIHVRGGEVAHATIEEIERAEKEMEVDLVSL